MTKILPVALSVCLVLATGALGIVLSNRASAKSESVLQASRVSLESTLAGLGKQYVLFSLKEGLDYASTGSWSLGPGDPADAARLHAFVDHAVLLNYGAALVNLSGQPLNAYASGPGLPPPTDPGYNPMKQALLAGQPDVSSLMWVGHIPVVAMAVPIEEDGQIAGLFVGFVRLDRSALETYVQRLHYGKSGQSYVVDSTGTVVAATNPAAIGTHLDEPRALAAIGDGKTGLLDDHRSKDTVTYSPLAIGGWGGLIVERSSEFYGPVQSGHLGIELGIIALLAVASGALLIFGYRREAARRRFHEILAHQATHDGLTDLANRSLFYERLGQALARAKRQHSGVVVLYLDLDGFKAVNDREGHDVGDGLLVEVAKRLRAVFRTEDTVARMGGDEFAILMEDVDDVHAVNEMAARAIREVSEPAVVKGRGIHITASVGIAASRAGHEDDETLMRDADLAMYRAKDAGKNGFVVASDPAAAASAIPGVPHTSLR
ncbi:MAG TPA: diguanylate cyclase [Acidimicrobiales bacterium]|nr:diguanylate cyclase [Acidimicrobiales bacterium]